MEWKSFNLTAMKSRAGASGRGASRNHHHHDDLDSVFELSANSLDSLKNKDENGEIMSFSDCCKGALTHLFNFTIVSCFQQYTKQVYVDNFDIDVMKETLRFHFMSPFQKWGYAPNRRFPWKLVLQLISICLVTTQLVMFANSKSVLTAFLHYNKYTFRHLFILDPLHVSNVDSDLLQPVRTMYTTAEVYDQLTFTAKQYFSLKQSKVNVYGYEWVTDHNVSVIPHLTLRVHQHSYAHVDPEAMTYVTSSDTTVDVYQVYNGSDPVGNTINWTEVEENISSIIAIELDFIISSVCDDNHQRNKCVQFNISFHISNDLCKGNLAMTMNVETMLTACNNDSTILNVDSGVVSDTGTTVLDVLVIFFAIVSIILCIRSIVNSFYLCSVVRSFFLSKFDWRLKWRHFLPLFNFWFVGIIVSNGLVLVGSIMKVVIAYTNPDSIALVDITSIMLGLAVFGQWCGVLRFLSYFDKYNILLITLRLALPSVIRFGVCAAILYFAFLFCGWLVLGPYNHKFSDPVITSDTLFSLVNGDDMFATYNEMSKASNAAWIFSKVYLYVFIALFIYVVLSVFISLISDTYETLRDHWSGRATSLLEDFANNHLERGRTRRSSDESHQSFMGVDPDYDMLIDIAVTGPAHVEESRVIEDQVNITVQDDEDTSNNRFSPLAAENGL